ncbi:hypothetical protein QBC43DRAFT_75609 [Cladorrhinum sp. PSN259]|nr:hypothetical protein QBC43DRAFT_75609 [Cladorrhinum sp. PSN259]
MVWRLLRSFFGSQVGTLCGMSGGISHLQDTPTYTRRAESEQVSSHHLGTDYVKRCEENYSQPCIRATFLMREAASRAGFASLTRAVLQAHRCSRVPPSTFFEPLGPVPCILSLGGYSIPDVHSVLGSWGCGFAVQFASLVGNVVSEPFPFPASHLRSQGRISWNHGISPHDAARADRFGRLWISQVSIWDHESPPLRPGPKPGHMFV